MSQNPKMTDGQAGSWGYAHDQELYCTGYETREEALDAAGIDAGTCAWTAFCVPVELTYPGSEEVAEIIANEYLPDAYGQQLSSHFYGANEGADYGDDLLGTIAAAPTKGLQAAVAPIIAAAIARHAVDVTAPTDAQLVALGADTVLGAGVKAAVGAWFERYGIDQAPRCAEILHEEFHEATANECSDKVVAE